MSEKLQPAEIITPGSIALLTTMGPEGPRTRPIQVQPDAQWRSGYLAVFTKAITRKAGDVAANPRVTLSAPTPTGWCTMEGIASVHPVDGEAVRIEIKLVRGRIWTCFSDNPFDHVAEEIEWA